MLFLISMVESASGVSCSIPFEKAYYFTERYAVQYRAGRYLEASHTESLGMKRTSSVKENVSALADVIRAGVQSMPPRSNL
ncbi:protein of unknown function [Methylocaldum szegediense]|uniref:Uncharacterized protein n=1 Tax=Methylocaldum szegediense TaxID=73780 RepID=A0ABM9HVS6_9GAMM|nr:protein of unknown function [Methylocaldum szegediense]